MADLHKVAAAMALASGYGGGLFIGSEEEAYYLLPSEQRTAPQRTVFAKPAKATFISEKPLTKRQRRRLRGKSER